MSLQDIVGRTAETRIIDLFAENYGNSYSQWEIYELTGISRNTLYKKLPEMVEKGIIEIKEEVGTRRIYRLAKNEAVKQLMAFVWKFNAMEAEKPEECQMVEPEQIIESENRYFKDPGIVSDDVLLMPNIKKEKAFPLEYEKLPIPGTVEIVKKIETQEQYAKAVTADSA